MTDARATVPQQALAQAAADGSAPIMLSSMRRQRILDHIVQQQGATVDELSDLFGVSKVTIRADLNYLASSGVVERSRGGAAPARHIRSAVPFSLRQETNREAKASIARLAATLLRSGETICLDAGTTVGELGTFVASMQKLTVVTPAIALAAQLCRSEQLDVVAIGGRLDPQMMSCAGQMTEFQISEIPVHKAFLGAHGIDDDGDIVEVSLEIARLKRTIAKAAREVILLADSSKWSTMGTAKVADIASIDVVVSDEGLSQKARKMLEDRGVELLLAPL